MAVWGGLTNSCERREAKSKGGKERYIHLNVEFQRIVRRHKKAFLSDQCKEIEENNRMGKTKDLFMSRDEGYNDLLGILFPHSYNTVVNIELQDQPFLN